MENTVDGSPTTHVSTKMISLRSSNPLDANRRTVDEMRQHIAKLKSELEAERTKNKQAHRDKVSEIRQVRESYEKEKEYALASLKDRLAEQKDNELHKVRETLAKERDQEIRVLNKHNEELVTHLKAEVTKEKDDAVKVALELQKKALSEQRNLVASPVGMSSALVVRLQRENKQLKEANKLLDSSDGNHDFVEELKQYHAEEIKRIIVETGQDVAHELERKYNAEICQKEEEIREMVALAEQMAEEKAQLECRLTDLERPAVVAVPSGGSSAHNQTFELDDTSENEDDDMHQRLHENRDREKERQLHKKVADLTSQVNTLEKRVGLFKRENQTLKRKVEEEKTSEEKIKRLKRRNAELASIARRLEEKVKQLQQESLKKSKEPSMETLKQTFAKQRARLLAEHAKTMLVRDREIDALEEKCRTLSEQLKTALDAQVLNSEIYEDKVELENIIKLSAKEKLLLERQLVQQPQFEADLRQLQELQQTNHSLEVEIEKLTKTVRHAEKLEVELGKKQVECESLNRDIENATKEYAQLESVLESVTEKNAQLSSLNSSLQQQVAQLSQVREECSTLRTRLSEVEDESEAAKSQVTSLVQKVHSLESQLKRSHETEIEKQRLNNDHQVALQQLQENEAEINMLSRAKENAEREHERAMLALQQKLQELEQRYDQQAVRHDERSSQMENRLQTLFTQPDSQNSAVPPGSSTVLPSVGNEFAGSPRMDMSRLSSGADVENTPTLNGSVRSSKGQLSESGSDDEEMKEIARKINALSLGSEGEESDGEADDEGRDEGNEEEGFSDSAPDKDIGENCERKRMAAGVCSKGGTSMKMPFQVFIAKYAYDPVAYSPNENPEAELSLNVGDYIFVYGSMDEDGFYEGELMSGKHGLVPSNFIEKVPDEDLRDSLALGESRRDEATYPQSEMLEFNSSSEVIEQPSTAVTEVSESRGQDDMNADVASRQDDMNADVASRQDDMNADVASREDDMSGSFLSPNFTIVEVEETGAGYIPSPRCLKVDRQLTSSILISWQPPESVVPGEVQSYHVYVDEEFKTSVKATERTKALVEGVCARMPHRLCVRSVTNKGHSIDNQCTLVFGKDAAKAPVDLTVSCIGPTSAVVSWMPADNNLQHIICIDNRERRTTRVGSFQHKLIGISPGCRHKVTVTSVTDMTSSGVILEHVQDSATIFFNTLHGGNPDPPLDIQVEAGPQEGTLLVTWLPVTITTTGKSNGAEVKGYAIYLDGRHVKNVNSPTGDHVILDYHDFFHIRNPQCLSIRTLAKDSESLDSPSIPLSAQLLEEVTRGQVTAIVPKVSKVVLGQITVDGTKMQNNEDVSCTSTANFRVIQSEPAATSTPTRISGSGDTPAQPEVKVTGPTNGQAAAGALSDMADASNSELSDIAEEEEEADVIDSSRSHAAGHAGSSRHQPQPLSAKKSGVTAPASAKHNGSPRHMSPSSPRNILTPDGASRAGFRPVTPTLNMQDRVPPRGAENTPTSYKPIAVPHIEITRDSGSNSSTSLDIYDVKATNALHHSANAVAMPTSDPSAAPDAYMYGAATTPTSSVASSCSWTAPVSQQQVVHPRNGFVDMNTQNATKQNSYIADGSTPRRPESAKFERRPTSAKQDRRPWSASSDIPADRRDIPLDLETTGRKSAGKPRSRTANIGKNGTGDYGEQCDPYNGYQTPRQDENSYSGLEDNNEYLSRKIHDDIADSDLIDYEDDGGDSLVESLDMEYDDTLVRIFIALFDYDPSIMSPNPDAIDEELPFKEGQLIKIFGDKDADGFFLGEANNRRGFVPCNMVSEVQVDDPEIAAQLLRESTRSTTSSLSRGTPSRGTPNRRTPSQNTMHRMTPGTPTRGMSPMTESRQNGSVTRHLGGEQRGQRGSNPNSVPTTPVPPPDGPPKLMVALYDYDPQELSPNVDAEVEVSFRAGDILKVYGEMDEDGFFYGEANGIHGLVPSNFLQDVPASHGHHERRSVQGTPRSNRQTSSRNTQKIVNDHSRSPQKANPPSQRPKQQERPKAANRQRPTPVTMVTSPTNADLVDGPTSESRAGSPASSSSKRSRASFSNDEAPLSPVRTLDFETNGEGKGKKRGFFAKSKNIFKKFSR